MSGTSRRDALRLGAAMAGSAAVAWWLRPAANAPGEGSGVDLDRLLPEQFGEWSLDREAAAFVRAADARGRQVGFYDQVLERTFVHGSGARVMLSVAYLGTQSSDMQLHRPEVCYRASGFRVGDLTDDTLQLEGRRIPVTRLVAQMPGRPEPITYWTIVDGEALSARAQGWLDRLQRMGRRRAADGLLVRISTIDTDSEAAFRLHARFAAAMAQALAPAQLDFVTGSPRRA
ncbi:MAG: exosortase C-terminal domain/associated protein EpsI [Piscinibacter sp.]